MKNFRTPVISGGTTQEQLLQMQNFLFQHVQQLNWAMGYLEGRSGTVSGTRTGGRTGSAETQNQQQSPQAVFNSIKSLIIKSADIVESYYQQISAKLVGVYVAQSDFGTYRQQTAAEISATNVQTISETVNGLYDSQTETSAYIRTGLLGYAEDGSAIYGMEVGQTNKIDGEDTFDKMARFTAGRMSFYDANDIEVAYISDYKLYITNAHITGNLIVGSMEFDTTDGLAIRDLEGEEA